MKTKLALFFLAATLAAASADEIKTRDGIKHRGAISHVDPDGIVIMTDSGTEKIPFTQVSEALQKQFHYDAQKAGEFTARMLTQQAAAVQRLIDAHSPAPQSGLRFPVVPAPSDSPAPAPFVPGDSALDKPAQRTDFEWTHKHPVAVFVPGNAGPSRHEVFERAAANHAGERNYSGRERVVHLNGTNEVYRETPATNAPARQAEIHDDSAIGLMHRIETQQEDAARALIERAAHPDPSAAGSIVPEIPCLPF